MEKVIKKVLVAALVIGVISSVSISGALASEVVAGDNSLSNDYIKVWVSDNKYSLDTTGGDPDLDTDDGKRLLYYETSRIFGSVDSNVRVVSPDYPDSSHIVDATNKSISGEYEFGGIRFKQVLTIVKNNTTNREDTVEFKLIATNEDTESHNVGARIMLDTMLGSNDYAPFRLSNIGEVTNRVQLEGNEIPDLYQAFDSLSQPTVIATGSFATGTGKPDIVQFTNWPISTNNILVPACDTEASLGDSAVNSIWQEKPLAAGETRVYKTYYGLGKVNVSDEANLVLGATKINQDFEVNEDGTGYNPVSIMGYVENSGNDTLNDVILNISLPEGVTLSEGEQNTIINSLGVSKTAQTTWTINAEPSYVEREIEVTINASSAETGEVTPIKYKYTIPALEMPATEPVTEQPTTEPVTEQPTTELVTEQPTTEPVTEQPTTEPVTEQPTTEPVTEQPTTELVTEQPTTEPVIEQPTTELVTEVETETQPTTQMATTATNPTTNSTQAPTISTTTATTATTATATNATVITSSNTETGKVATGESSSIIAAMATLLGVSSLFAVINRKRREKNK